MRILIALPGIHRYNRGAELAFMAVARELALSDEVTLIGSGNEVAAPYRFLRARSLEREHFERFPSFPPLRNEYCYEELTFAPELLLRYRPRDYDITVTCSYPFTNWILRRPVLLSNRPKHIFVTHNGDWPAYAGRSGVRSSENYFFGCDGLICINPDFFARNNDRWNCRLIPNGVDCERFSPGAAARSQFGLPQNKLVVLIVSALIENKRVGVGIDAVSRIPEAHLAIAGDGPLRDQILDHAEKVMPTRFTRLSVSPAQMPLLYRSADVFMQCSKDEPFPLVFLEAMACGIPIVAHDISRVRWFLGDNEFLVKMDDPSAIAQRILDAHQHRAENLSERVKRARTFSWPNVAAQYRSFFQDVLKASPKALDPHASSPQRDG
jgi:glycosyltransferase involved in cell wall biosynthesis